MKTIKLTNEQIDQTTEELISFFTSKGIEKREVTRNRLIIEEILNKFQERFGEDTQVNVSFSAILNQVRCSVSLAGDAFNPLEGDDEMSMKMMSALLDYEGGTPNWTYRNGVNTVFIMARRKRKMKLITQIAISLVVAIILGIIARSTMGTVITGAQNAGTGPAPFVVTLCNDYLSPIANAFTGLLCVMAVLLTFFALPLGINAVGNVESVGKLSKTTVRRMYTIMAVASVASAIIVATTSSLRASHITGSGGIAIASKSLFDIVIGFVPTGFVAPFLNFNSIQILIIGAMFGFAFLAMGEKAGKVLEIFDSLNLAAILTNNFLNAFIPYYVAISVFTGIVNADITALSSVPQIIIYCAIGFILLIGLYTARISIKYGVSPIQYMRKLLPTFLICLSSGSFGACFTTCINAVLDMGADGTVTNFVINIGGIVFKPAHSITFLVSSTIMASVFGMEITIPWLIFAVLLSVILTVAVPNVPGASASVYALLFTQLGLPAQALVLMISINAFLEFVMVAVNTYCLQSEIIVEACDTLEM